MIDSPDSRRHDIDVLRCGAFALLILYHAAMLWVADWGWHLKSSMTAEWLQWPMMALNRWRMPLLFLISGVALTWLLRSRSGAQVALARCSRLLLPLLFGMAVVVPIQPYCQGVVNGLVEPGFASFVLRYWQLSEWPAGAFDGWEWGITWNHLWYLPYVWLYSMLVLGVRAALPARWRQRAAMQLERCGVTVMVIVPSVWLCAVYLPLRDRFEITHNLVWDWLNHAMSLSYFVLGVLLGTAQRPWARLRARVGVLCVLALSLLAGMMSLLVALPDDAPRGAIVTLRICAVTYAWLAVLALLALAHRFLNRDGRGLAWARESVFPWYVLHQSLIVGIAYAVVPWQLGPVLEPLVVIGGTVLGCWALTDGLIRRVNPLRPLFGLPARERQRVARAVTA